MPRVDPEARHAADKGHAQVDGERYGPERTLGEAIHEPGWDEQRRGEQETRREPEEGLLRLRRVAGGQHEQDHVQEPHHEVG
jgi:hypothetical protein